MFSDFLGFAAAGSTFVSAVTITDASSTPLDPAAAPTWRCYDGSTLLEAGTLTKLDTGVITNVTDANPMVVTSAGHGLQTGDSVTISGVTGNTAANATWQVTVIDPNTFSVAGAGNGAYVAGGAWHTTGLYQLSLDLSQPGFESGGSYQVLVSWTAGATPLVSLLTLGVL